jgi:hypothetical protein
MITLDRANAIRDEIQHELAAIEISNPGSDVDALHASLADAWAKFRVVAARLLGSDPGPIHADDGSPKS